MIIVATYPDFNVVYHDFLVALNRIYFTTYRYSIRTYCMSRKEYYRKT